MSVYLFSGSPGGGKSLHATENAIDWLRRGKNVIANFPVNMGYFKKKKKLGKFVYLPDAEITVDYLLKFDEENHKHTKGKYKAQTLVIFDEAGIKFNSREWDSKGRGEWLKFFALHRHFYYDIILVAQNDRMLDRQVRGQIETEFKHRSMKNYKLFGKILNLLCGGLFVAVEYFYPIKLYIGKRFFRLNKRKANAYDTMALFDANGSQQQTGEPETVPQEKGERKCRKKIDWMKVHAFMKQDISIKELFSKLQKRLSA